MNCIPGKLKQRWIEVQNIHQYLSVAPKKGSSMENALGRTGSRYLTQNDLVISIMDEYGIQPPTLNLEKHLRAFYNTFPDSDKKKVDSYAILCTFLSITQSGVIIESPKKIFDKFCDIYSEEDDFIELCDLLSVSSIGITTLTGSERVRESFLSAYKHRDRNYINGAAISKEVLELVLNENRYLMTEFKEQILKNLNTRNRLTLIKSREDILEHKLNEKMNQLMIKRALMKWKDTLYQSFCAWAQLAQEESRSRLLELRMNYWRVHKALLWWRNKVKRSKNVINLLTVISAAFKMSTKRHGFKRWRLVMKIQKSCYFQSDRFKRQALGLTLMDIAWFNAMKRHLFIVWLTEFQVEVKMEWGATIYKKLLSRRCVSKWKIYCTDSKRKRDESLHKRWAIKTIHNLMFVDTNEMYLSDDADSKSCINALKVKGMKAIIDSDIDKKILLTQRQMRMKRNAMEKSMLLLKWNDHWKELELRKVREVTKDRQHWLNTKNGKENVKKYLNQIQSELRVPPEEASDLICIILSVLDGKLAEIGMLSESFFDKLSDQCGQDQMKEKECFIAYLSEIGVKMDNSQVRDMFLEIEHRGIKTNTIIPFLINKIKATYDFIGNEGTRYKKYASACHNEIIFHDVFTNEIILEHNLTKRKLQEIAFDHFIAQGVIIERRKIKQMKNQDLISRMTEFSTLKIQQYWRRRNELRKTRLRIQLNHNRISKMFQHAVDK